MNTQLPVADDTVVWDAWMSLYQVPALSVALELKIFEALLEQPSSPEMLAQRLRCNLRGLRALLPFLMSIGFLQRRGGEYHLAEAARHYLIESSPFYWGGVFKRLSGTILPHKLLLETLRNERGAAGVRRPADGWESGEMDMDLAREVTAFMHSHSMAAAVGMTHTCDFSGVRTLLDVGGGSGCFSIALANAFPGLRCTVMELPAICELARGYIENAGVGGRVDTVSVDMFRQDWPQGYDALFFSNIFHDWSLETCAELSARAFDALAPGGRIFLHEMLLDDGGASPHPALAFSLLMAMGTLGQQFSFPQLEQLLRGAGFEQIECRHSYGYYSLVSARKG